MAYDGAVRRPIHLPKPGPDVVASTGRCADTRTRNRLERFAVSRSRATETQTPRRSSCWHTHARRSVEIWCSSLLYPHRTAPRASDQFGRFDRPQLSCPAGPTVLASVSPVAAPAALDTARRTSLLPCSCNAPCVPRCTMPGWCGCGWVWRRASFASRSAWLVRRRCSAVQCCVGGVVASDARGGRDRIGAARIDTSTAGQRRSGSGRVRRDATRRANSHHPLTHSLTHSTPRTILVFQLFLSRRIASLGARFDSLGFASSPSVESSAAIDSATGRTALRPQTRSAGSLSRSTQLT
jgi:hypothetical protein